MNIYNRVRLYIKRIVNKYFMKVRDGDMFKLKGFQKKILADESDSIIVNMSRGGGRTFLCLMKMIKEQPKECLYLNGIIPKNQSIKRITDKLNYIIENIEHNTVHLVNKSNDNYIEVLYKNGQSTKLYFEKEISYNKQYDLVLMDNLLLQKDLAEGKKYFSTINISGHISYILGRKDISIYEVGLKELIENGLYNNDDNIGQSKKYIGQLSFNNEIDILCEYDSIFKNDIEKENNITYNDLIEKYKKELNKINTSKDTTMYRRDLVNIIESLIKCNQYTK